MGRAIKFDLPTNLFLKDPQDSKLGVRILEHGVLLMHEIGFEAFTFKKLAKKIASAEASIYRYFENKHLFLLYINSWYWEWMHYLIDTSMINIKDPYEKMEHMLNTIVDARSETVQVEFFNIELLHEIIIIEGSKSFHINNVDSENEAGLFLSYKTMIEKMSYIIKELNPNFKYPLVLANTLVETANNQIYYAEHLPRLTELNKKDDSKVLKEILTDILNRMIRD